MKIYKKIFISNDILDSVLRGNKLIRTRSRSTTIIKEFIGLTFSIYNGKNYTSILIKDNMVGSKLGEFAYTKFMNISRRVRIQKNKNKK